MSALIAIFYGKEISRQTIPAEGVPVVPVTDQTDGPFMTDECRIYWAPSSIKGVAGMGLFTVAHYQIDDFLLNSPDGPSIPVIDYMNHEPNSIAHKQWIGLFDNYWWGRGVADHTLYEADVVIDYQIMFGALPNHHCVLDSLDFEWPSPAYDDEIVLRGGPGTGAVSYHTGRAFKTSKNLVAGDELFLNYGHCDHDPQDPEWAKHIAQNDDFEKATTDTLKMWKLLRGAPPSQYDEMISNFTASRPKASFGGSLLPSSFTQLESLMKGGKKNLLRNIAKEFTTVPRSVDWIKEKGFCVEALVSGRSQIPHAGQGAFAQWKIRRNEVIVPVPLLHISDKEALKIRNTEGDTIGHQLLSNYCFGHHESSLLLCPASNAILLNHCSSKHCSSGPNAILRWASWDNETQNWLSLTYEELKERPGRGLTLEVVALRDIEQGEEVLIDYGKDWEDAWIKHTQEWKNDPGATAESVTQLNRADRPVPPELLSNDLRSENAHPTILTGCRYWITEDDENEDYDRENFSWKTMPDEEILEEFSDDGSDFTGAYESHMDGEYWPCTVISVSEPNQKRYSVRIHKHPHFDEDILWDTNDLPRILTNYPRASIRYFNRPYTSDLHVNSTFRRSPGLPEGVFPDSWKNLKS